MMATSHYLFPCWLSPQGRKLEYESKYEHLFEESAFRKYLPTSVHITHGSVRCIWNTRGYVTQPTNSDIHGKFGTCFEFSCYNKLYIEGTMNTNNVLEIMNFTSTLLLSNVIIFSSQHRQAHVFISTIRYLNRIQMKREFYGLVKVI